MSSRPSRGAARLASILDALPDALLIVNANGTVVNANTIALETFETPGTALVGRGLLDLLPGFDPKRIPGSMRSPREEADDTRTKPTRMLAHRTDGTPFPAQVTSANLEDGRTPYADFGDGVPHYTGDELLMLVVRDLSGTVDTEAELARQQRQTEMILRAAAEGVVGVDTAGRIVLVNPSAAQILGHRATDLGGKELHPLVHHSRADGSPLAYEETPLADTLRSGRKHRVRGQVLWRKDGKPVPVDLTTAPVRDGDQLVGAVMTFTDRTQYDAIEARNEQLRALLDTSLRAPLAELRGELTGLAADPAGQLWPEANQILHHLSAGYSRITTLIDNVLAFQRLDRGEDRLRREPVGLDELVAAAVEGAVDLIGPGRAQYAVHAPASDVSVDGSRMAQALSHLIADVAGVDSAGNAIAFSGDSTIVVAAARRGEVVRIDVRGPSAGGDPVHLPLARGIVERHGGVLQTHEVPGQGSAYVLEVPVGPENSATAPRTGGHASPSGQSNPSGAGAGAGAGAHQGAGTGPGGDRAGASGTSAAPGASGTADGAAQPARPPQPRDPADDTGTVLAPWDVQPAAPADRSAPGGPIAPAGPVSPAAAAAADHAEAPTGRRRALRRPSSEPDEHGGAAGAPAGQPSGAPEGGGPADQPTGRRARRARPEEEGTPAAPRSGSPAPASAPDAPAAAAAASAPVPAPAAPAAPEPPDAESGRPELPAPPIPNALPPAGADAGTAAGTVPGGTGSGAPHEGGGRRGRRAIEPPAGGGGPVPVPPQGTAPGVHPGWPAAPDAHRPASSAQAWPAASQSAAPGGPPGQQDPAVQPDASAQQQDPAAVERQHSHGRAISVRTLGQGVPYATDPRPAGAQGDLPAQVAAGGSGRRRRLGAPQQSSGSILPQVPSQPTPGQSVPGQPAAGQPAPGQPMPGQPGQPMPGQGLAPHQQPNHQPQQHQSQPQTPTQPPPRPQSPPRQQPQQPLGPGGETQARQHPQADPDSGQLPVRRPGAAPQNQPQNQPRSPHQDPRQDQRQNPQRPSSDPDTALLRPVPAEAERGRSYAIGAPAEGAAEGPEPLDGPNGAVDVTDVAGARGGAVELPDDRLPEPLDEPRRLLVWPEPDVSTRQALTDRGYRPVIVRSREEVDAQVAEPPAALFVDPLTGPITRTALQSLRQAAAAADVPVLVTAGLGQATREAAYGADPAVLLKALAPRDSEQHPPRVLLVESHEPIARAFAATLERRGMQVTHAGSEVDAMTQAAQMHPNLVVMDLMLIRRRRQGIVDWLRGNARLNSTPLVVYTSADIDPAELPRLASGETVLFLAERSTSTDVQSRIVDLLGKIGA